MMRTFMVFYFLAVAATSQAMDHKHTKWDTLLKKHVSVDGSFDYGLLKKNVEHRNLFTEYLKELSSVKFSDFKTFSRHQKMAFLINAYNAFTVELILRHYPVKSIRKIGGLFEKPWDIEFFKLLGGKIKSLDPIEHEYLRPVYKDYRIHAAVNCASISCPKLRGGAFVAPLLDAQLDEQMKIWLHDSGRNEFNPEKGTMKLSKIFDWFEEDFDKWGGGVLKVVKKFAPPRGIETLKKTKEIDYLDYNWQLNDTKKT